MKRSLLIACLAALLGVGCATTGPDNVQSARCDAERTETERVVRALYAAQSRRDIEAVRAVYAPNVDFIDPTFGYQFDNRDAVIELFVAALPTFESSELTVEEIVISDCTRAAVRGQANAIYHGAPLEADFFAILDVADGQITRQRDFWPRFPLQRRIREIDAARAAN